MLTKDFYFELPDELIAQHPSDIRGQDKLMVLGRSDGKIQHVHMENLPDLIEPGTLMIFNNSKVRRSRCFGQKMSTPQNPIAEELPKPVEFLILENSTSTMEGYGEKVHLWRAMVKSAKKQRVGYSYRFVDGTIGTIVENPSDVGTEFRTLSFCRPNGDSFLDEEWFEVNGHIPLPPYIRRGDNAEDAERYQNVYADVTGSVACPTAGLHFTQNMLNSLKNRGVEMAHITLHVGLGTFLPVRSEHITDHKMHNEVFTIDESVSIAVNKTKKEGRPILAVGTTSVRALESAWDKENGQVRTGTQSTSIFLYPGCTFNLVTQLFTNFHTPESTLLMLVSAFAGKESIATAYKEAVNERYRFFSYGDAMFIR